MKLPPTRLHPKGELISGENTDSLLPIELETFDGKVRVEWDPDASVSPFGQLPFFIQFLKAGQRFDPWVDDCPLTYQSNNAPDKRDVLGHSCYPFCQDIPAMHTLLPLPMTR